MKFWLATRELDSPILIMLISEIIELKKHINSGAGASPGTCGV